MNKLVISILQKLAAKLTVAKQADQLPKALVVVHFAGLQL